MGRSVLGEVVIVGFDSSSSSSWAQRLLWRREDGFVRNQGGVCEVHHHCDHQRSSSPFMGWWPQEWVSWVGESHLQLHHRSRDPSLSPQYLGNQTGWLSLFHAMVFKRFLIWYFQGVKRSWFIFKCNWGLDWA